MNTRISEKTYRPDAIGALLSALIEPIYFTSIIIGSLYHSEHIRRALFARIEHVRIEFGRSILR